MDDIFTCAKNRKPKATCLKNHANPDIACYDTLHNKAEVSVNLDKIISVFLTNMAIIGNCCS